jgi:V/A-type H+-transporting ATPase subunit E
VNPEDVGFAKNIFAGADIIPDKTIAGGVDAMTDGGEIRVINTFEKRLERAWVDMLPELLKKVYDAVEESP